MNNNHALIYYLVCVIGLGSILIVRTEVDQN